ncbi:MAG: GNAT family N-acetyltransferase [Ruminococcus sp.]|nr:GNAT family N-acetyltransferase [Ruminococcus sp.]
MKIVSGEGYTKEITELIGEYNKALGRDLSFQGFDEEIKDLAVKYSYPNGRLLCAVSDDGKVIGCVAYHRHDDRRCEMKRLFVKPRYRELHAGRQLIEAIIELAKNDGFEEMVLDTITPLQSAIHLYKKFGFEQCEPYYDNPMSDVVYMKKILR